MRKLTHKHAAFVVEYLVDMNATQAAIRAGYSIKSAKTQGQRLLTKADVATAIQKAQARREVRTEITQDQVVAELAKIAFGNARDVMEWGPGGVTLKNSDELTEAQAAGVAEVSENVTKDGGSIRIKRHDKVKALELLGRHLGMFTDNVNNNLSGNLVITWQDSNR